MKPTKISGVPAEFLNLECLLPFAPAIPALSPASIPDLASVRGKARRPIHKRGATVLEVKGGALFALPSRSCWEGRADSAFCFTRDKAASRQFWFLASR